VGVRDTSELAGRFEPVQLVRGRHERLTEDRGDVARRGRAAGDRGEDREEATRGAMAPELVLDEPVDGLPERPQLDEVEPWRPRRARGANAANRRRRLHPR
jgi:hypothetical protein